MIFKDFCIANDITSILPSAKATGVSLYSGSRYFGFVQVENGPTTEEAGLIWFKNNIEATATLQTRPDGSRFISLTPARKTISVTDLLNGETPAPGVSGKKAKA